MDILLLALFALAGLVLFWGAIAYIVVRFFKSDSTGLSKQQKIDLVTQGMQAYSGSGGGSGDLMDTEAGSAAAGAGIDLNDNR